MKAVDRPSFQFYPGDWLSNNKLRFCSHEEKGVWIDIMSLMHDSAEYGILRYTLQEMAGAVRCKMNILKSLQKKCILKGADSGIYCEPFIFTPRHAGKDGEPVILIPKQIGAIWYSSRMVRDEYLRKKRANPNLYLSSPNYSPNKSPKGGIGELSGEEPMGDIGDLPSTSSSTSNNKYSKNQYTEYFQKFWQLFPPQRMGNKDKAFIAWKAALNRTEPDKIIAAVKEYSTSMEVTSGYAKNAAKWLKDDGWASDYSIRPVKSMAAKTPHKLENVGII